MKDNAIDGICRRYYRDVYLYLYALTRDREQSEDLTQETFLKALVSLSPAHPNPKAWLLTVARNLRISSLRNKREDSPLPETLPSTAPGPPEALIRSEREKALFAAMDRLDPRSREAIVLRYFEELTNEEIAALLGEAFYPAPEIVSQDWGAMADALESGKETLRICAFSFETNLSSLSLLVDRLNGAGFPVADVTVEGGAG